MNEIESKFLSESDAATYLSISKKTLQRLRCSGGGPDFCKLGKGRGSRVIYPLQGLHDWAMDKKCQSTSTYMVGGAP